MNDKRDGINRSQIEAFQEFATDLLEYSRCISRKYQVQDSEIQTKTVRGDPVTQLDTMIEQEWRDRIRSRYPEHNIIGEETGSYITGSDITWALDPIDGTDDLVRGSPLYGSIIAVLYKGDPIVGITDHPKLNLRCQAAYGSNAMLNGAEIRHDHSRHKYIGEAVVLPAYDDMRKLNNCDQILIKIGREYPNQRIYRNVFGHTMVVSGMYAAGLEVNVALWDLAATRLLVEQSNGKFVIFRDTGGDWDERRFGAVFGQTAAVDTLLSIINGAT